MDTRGNDFQSSFVLKGDGRRRWICLPNVHPCVDRDRGGGHPPTPATPPCVRVRTRRFETFGLTSLEQRRKTAIAEIGIRERNMQSFRMGQMPRAVGTAGGVSGQPWPYTPFN